MNKSRKMLATLLALIISTMAITPAFTAPLPPAIWLEPTSISLNTATHSIGYKFNLTLWISTASPSYTWQAKVNFNPAHLQVTRSKYTGGSTSMFFTGLATVPVGAVIDNVTGSVTCGESLQGDIQRELGSDSLQWIEFQVVAVPGVGVTWNELITVEGPAGGNTFILDPGLSEIGGLSVAPTTYTFTWTAPGPAQLEVTPASQSFGYPPPTLVVGTTFTSDVVITSLSAGWYLGNATTHLGYISTLLSVTSVTFDPIWGTTSTVGSVAGDLYLEVKAPTSNPSGTVKIATVTFTILFQDTAPPRPFPPAPGSSDDTPLDLNNYALFSISNIPVTTNAAVDGLVQIFAYKSTTGPMTDIDGDGKVNMKDIAIVAHAFGTHEGDGRWNPLADVNGDGYVNLFDIALVAKDFGKQ